MIGVYSANNIPDRIKRDMVAYEIKQLELNIKEGFSAPSPRARRTFTEEYRYEIIIHHLKGLIEVNTKTS